MRLSSNPYAHLTVKGEAGIFPEDELSRLPNRGVVLVVLS
jgi:hypothetical protein